MDLPRDQEKSEKNFMLKTMLRGYRFSPECSRMESSYYYSFFSDIFIKLITTQQVKIEKENNRITGFSLFNDEYLHFVYVRQPERQKKIAYELIQHLIKSNTIKVTFSTKDFWDAFQSKNRIQYHPFVRYIK